MSIQKKDPNTVILKKEDRGCGNYRRELKIRQTRESEWAVEEYTVHEIEEYHQEKDEQKFSSKCFIIFFIIITFLPLLAYWLYISQYIPM